MEERQRLMGLSPGGGGPPPPGGPAGPPAPHPDMHPRDLHYLYQQQQQQRARVYVDPRTGEPIRDPHKQGEGLSPMEREVRVTRDAHVRSAHAHARGFIRHRAPCGC